MSDDVEGGCFGAFLLFLGFVVGGFALGAVVEVNWQKDVEAWRQESVRRGAAEWVMDPTTGKTEWRWKEGKL